MTGRCAAAAVLALSCAAAAPAAGQEAVFELSAASVAVIGSPILVQGTVRYPAGHTLSLDLKAQEPSAFEVLSAKAGQPTAGPGGESQASLKLEVMAFALGSQALELSWTLTGPGGAAATVKNPPVRFEVTAPAGADQGDIRDIKPPLSPPVWPAATTAFLVLAAAVYGLVRWLDSRRRPLEYAVRFDPRTPHEAALEELERLRGADLPAKEYYTRMTDVLRVYLERRFAVPAMRLTTSELMRKLRRLDLDRTVTQCARGVFDRADLVKFARHVPEAADLERDLDSAVAFVRATVPPPPQEGAAEDAARAGR